MRLHQRASDWRTQMQCAWCILHEYLGAQRWRRRRKQSHIVLKSIAGKITSNTSIELQTRPWYESEFAVLPLPPVIFLCVCWILLLFYIFRSLGLLSFHLPLHQTALKYHTNLLMCARLLARSPQRCFEFVHVWHRHRPCSTGSVYSCNREKNKSALARHRLHWIPNNYPAMQSSGLASMAFFPSISHAVSVHHGRVSTCSNNFHWIISLCGSLCFIETNWMTRFIVCNSKTRSKCWKRGEYFFRIGKLNVSWSQKRKK